MLRRKNMNIHGVKFTWSLLGYDVLRNALGEVMIGWWSGYFVSYANRILFLHSASIFLYREISHLKVRAIRYIRQSGIFWHGVVISLICNGLNNLWMPIAAVYVPPAIYNILVTFITGGVSMIIFFFVFKIIFPEGEKK